MHKTKEGGNGRFRHFRQSSRGFCHDVDCTWCSRCAVIRHSKFEVLPKAKAAALKALALDEDLAEGHCVLGVIYGEYEWDWTAEEREIRRAIQLDPNSTSAHSAYAFYLATVGRKNAAVHEIETALELDPFSPLQHSTASYVFFWDGQYDAAVREARRAIEIDPDFADGHLALAGALEAKGDSDESVAEWLRYSILDGNARLAQEFASTIKKMSTRSDAGLKLANIALSYYQEKARSQYVAPLTIAETYLELGDKEKAFEWLNKAYEERSTELYDIAVDPFYDPLRSDPRFQELLRRMNLKP